MKLCLIFGLLISIAGFGSVAVADPTPMVIPLINFSGSGQLGIDVLLGTNPNPRTYILDTGSFAFATALGTSANWTGSDYTDTGTTFHIAYGDGSLQYDGNVATANITLSNANGDALLPINNATLGVITNQPYPNWNSDINSNPPIPPESPVTHQFFGTFGAGLDETASGLSSILGQIPLAPGLNPGWIIHTGGAASSTPTLTIGLTAADIASFPILLPMNASTGSLLTSTGVTVTLYPESQVFANYTFENNGDVYTHSGNMVIDSGGLNTHYETDDTLPGNIETGSDINPGTTFSAVVAGTSGNTGLDWTFLTGNTDYVNKVTVTSGSGTLNTGIAIYYQYDIMYDLQDGIVGLRPIAVPEPSIYALVSGGAVLLLTALGRKRFRR